MRGKLTGIGVGPGDPKLLTIKALEAVRDSDVVAVPGEEPKDSVAYQIVEQIYPELAGKVLLPVSMPMTKDPVKLEENHERGANAVRAFLDEGKQVVFLTLGDPSVYSTYLYIHKKVQAAGYETEIISGITSFCAAAARLNIGLVEKAQQLHVIPASYQIEEALKLPGTKVLMKAGKKIEQVKKVLQQQDAQVVMIENCGMPGEKVYYGADAIPEDAGYYSLIIVKEKS
ncbi:Cobalt-precorrin-2 C(20)-methyltransferase [uncultured Roseburia sp.]|uniref:Precorrin-2 C(20)-methyltransferase n=1 Tax=Brotonthovivens ammoniilytica TaxID=2981725 RepID=A0ABT2TMG8_9FIRM|nr:precorrin-2 C(20)-methyltransferase [Brotonthovivens ammoniilytica]MCU6763356.1 precorrin-2 C(20)-methyltransferase [Brotonthovivens ammoniilytica]SCJ14703.1 Cobalt-precorrin-2 C(20)-methyltransferase [uncultured Roseburia sp.]